MTSLRVTVTIAAGNPLQRMDKVYQVVEGEGLFLLEDKAVPMEAGMVLVAPSGAPHGIRNTGPQRLLVLAILAPAP